MKLERATPEFSEQWVSDFMENSVMKVYGSTLEALRGVGQGVKFPEKSVVRNT